MWFFEGRGISTIELLPEDAFGFVYCIRHKDTGKFYIGKKNLYSVRTKPLTQKELAEQAELKKPGRKKTTKLVTKESDWMSYWGSEPALKEDIKVMGKDQFERTIIDVCFSKKQLTYCELKHQIKYGVLESDNCYNSNIAGTYFRKDLL